MTLGLLGLSLGECGVDLDALWALRQSAGIAESLGAAFILCDTSYYQSLFLLKRERWEDAEPVVHSAIRLAGEQNRTGLAAKLEKLLACCRQKVPVPGDADWVGCPAAEPSGRLKPPPPLPEEAANHSIAFTDLKAEIEALSLRKK